MEEILNRILENYAEKTEKQSRRNLDNERKAYMAGKADGLRQAKALLHMIVEYGPAESGEFVEVS